MAYFTSCKVCGTVIPLTNSPFGFCLLHSGPEYKALQTQETLHEIPRSQCIVNPLYDDIDLETLLQEIKEEDIKESKIKDRKETLVVNLFAGPGCGKSSIAAGIFHNLKWKNVECEMALEFAKDLVWEERHQTFNDQIYLFGKQHHRIFRLLGQVEVIITDCPILLTPIYDKEKRCTLERLVVEEHNKMWTYNVFLNRSKQYNPKGRNQTEEEAKNLDRDIIDLLTKHNVMFETFYGTQYAADGIVVKILRLLEWKKNQNL